MTDLPLPRRLILASAVLAAAVAACVGKSAARTTVTAASPKDRALTELVTERYGRGVPAVVKILGRERISGGTDREIERVTGKVIESTRLKKGELISWYQEDTVPTGTGPGIPANRTEAIVILASQNGRLSSSGAIAYSGGKTDARGFVPSDLEPYLSGTTINSAYQFLSSHLKAPQNFSTTSANLGITSNFAQTL